MRSALVLCVIGLVGLFGAASIGYAAYVVSRDTVGAPVTKVKLSPNDLAPPKAERTSRPNPTTTTRAVPPPPPPPTTTSGSDDDGSGHGRGRGRGGDDDNSGRGGGGGDDD
ncbi:MAG TPA: hypothetical protein VFT86_02820 [Gaiellaceae bacterium]|nr:hypothetical protein [Gaiellaceae bacterium]